ncbi:MAG: DUF2156 domain-containing protein [Rhodobacteraceae bacterium]|nr:DUF2156 domain-containing protein [Paracoccaceae bacterium]
MSGDVKGLGVKNKATAGNLRRLAARQMVPLGLSIALFLLLWDRTSGLDFGSIWAGLGKVTTLKWCTAGCLSAASFWAVGRYDMVVHRMTGTGVNSAQASRAGIAAIAVAQTVGFGVISGALVRWRMLAGLSLLQSIRISITVSLSFLAGWACVTALALILTGATLPVPALSVIAASVLFATSLAALLSLVRPGPLARLKLPSIRAMGAILLLTVVDTITAGGALYALLPASAHIDLPTFIAAFLVALGAGLIMGTPGGVGPFEVTLIALLPQLEVQDLLSAVLAFRVVYYALPALIGAAIVIRGPTGNPALDHETPDILRPGQDIKSPALDHLINTAPEGEASLLRQGHLSVLRGQDGYTAMVSATNQSLVMLRGPLRSKSSYSLLVNEMQRAANVHFLAPSLYKAPARLALAARRAGWQVLPIAREAYLDPQDYSCEGRIYRQLRRKLRKADAAGVNITIADATAPLAEMAEIAKEWSAKQNGERGFSMGKWDPATVQYAKVFLAWQNGELLGFLTLHQNQHERVLDLMRYGQSAPEGLMHLLLDHAIRDARTEGITRLSLASVPIGKQAQENLLFGQLRAHLDRVSGADGLRQFKSSFAPSWQTLYFAAPSRISLVLSAIDISRQIARAV